MSAGTSPRCHRRRLAGTRGAGAARDIPCTRRFVVYARPLGAALLAVLLIGSAVPTRAATRDVRVGTCFYEDATPGDGEVAIDAGDSITFRFPETNEHTATVNGMFDSGSRANDQTYTTAALTRPGRYTLYCSIHSSATHSATLVIRSRATSAPSPTRPAPAPSRSTTPPRPSPTPKASAAPRPPSPKPTPSPVESRAAGSATSSPSKSTSPSPSATPPAAAVEPPPPAASTPTPTAAPAADDAPDVAPAVALDDGVGWLLPLALILFAAGLAAGAIALGKRRRTS